MRPKTVPLPADIALSAALVMAARSGASDALGQLLEAARPQLLALANRTMPHGIRGKCGPSDIVQQTAIDAHRGISGFAGESPEEFFCWLRVILRNNVLDSIRHYQSSRSRDVDREVSLDDPRPHPTVVEIAPVVRRPDDSAVRREEMLAVERALDTLTPDRRAAVWMRHWEGRSFADIGERLGSTEGAARKLWYRGVRELCDMIHAMPAFASEASGLGADAVHESA